MPKRRALALRLVICGALAALSPADASVPSLADCFEGSDFIANAAQSRDNGMTRDAFMNRLAEDFVTIHAFPAELRWFAKDEDDEQFLADAARFVFDAPATPADHRTQFLRACFARLTI
jgi:hypothetical protein